MLCVTTQSHSNNHLRLTPGTPPPLVRVQPSLKTHIPQRRDYISLPPKRNQQQTSCGPSSLRQQEHDQNLRQDKSIGSRNAWGSRLSELQYRQNCLLREENELLRQEVKHLRELLERQTQHLNSFVRSFEIFGDALQEGLGLLPPEASSRLLTNMMTSLQSRSPESTCTLPSINNFLSNGLICEASMFPPKVPIKYSPPTFESDDTAGASKSDATELEFTTRFGRDLQSVTTTAESPLRRKMTGESPQVKWSNRILGGSAMKHDDRTAVADESEDDALDGNEGYEEVDTKPDPLPSHPLSEPAAPASSEFSEHSRALLSSVWDNRVPKLSLEGVLPSSWLSGEATAGDTYVTLRDEDDDACAMEN